jgi:peroxin-5
MQIQGIHAPSHQIGAPLKPHIPSGNWANDFESQTKYQPLDRHLDEDFESIYETQNGMVTQPPNWSSNPRYHPPNIIARPFNDSLDRMRGPIYSDIVNSTEIEPKSVGEQWAKEFKKQQEQEQQTISISEKDSADALSKTAGIIANIVEGADNQKFQNSKFLGFMKDLRDKKLAIEGDKLVEQIIPAQMIPSSHQMAEEFLGQRIRTWEHNVELETSTSTEQPIISPRNFQKQIDENWSKEFHGETLQQQFSSDVSHDMDWSSQFRGLHNIERDSHLEKQLYQEDWSEQFREKMSLRSEKEQEVTWNNLENSYDKAFLDPIKAAEDIDQLFSASNNIKYEFVPNNPYLNLQDDQLKALRNDSNLVESILLNEAILQNHLGTSQDWFQLGRKQQENENETAAIAALTKSLELDRNNLSSYLALAGSFTNENRTQEAYSALMEWLQRNPKYKIQAHTLGNEMSSSQKHDLLVQSYLAAAMAAPGDNLDVDVQQALGILFNISSEYSKAIDCFQSAISANPTDHELWNKFGYGFDDLVQL